MMDTVRHLVTEACGLVEACRHEASEDALRRVELLRVELLEALDDCSDEELFQDGRALDRALAAVLDRGSVTVPQRLAS